MSDLGAAGRRLGRARTALQLAVDGARQAAIAALSEGVSEAEVSRTLGVDRMTVRKWAGKR